MDRLWNLVSSSTSKMVSSVFSSPLKKIVKHFLKKSIGKYLSTQISDDMLDVALLSGKLVLKNLVIQIDAIRPLIAKFPFTITYLSIGSIEVNIPLHNLLSEPGSLHISDLVCCIDVKGDAEMEKCYAEQCEALYKELCETFLADIRLQLSSMNEYMATQSNISSLLPQNPHNQQQQHGSIPSESMSLPTKAQPCAPLSPSSYDQHTPPTSSQSPDIDSLIAQHASVSNYFDGLDQSVILVMSFLERILTSSTFMLSRVCLRVNIPVYPENDTKSHHVGYNDTTTTPTTTSNSYLNKYTNKNAQKTASLSRSTAQRSIYNSIFEQSSASATTTAAAHQSPSPQPLPSDPTGRDISTNDNHQLPLPVSFFVVALRLDHLSAHQLDPSAGTNTHDKTAASEQHTHTSKSTTNSSGSSGPSLMYKRSFELGPITLYLGQFGHSSLIVPLSTIQQYVYDKHHQSLVPCTYNDSIGRIGSSLPYASSSSSSLPLLPSISATSNSSSLDLTSIDPSTMASIMYRGLDAILVIGRSDESNQSSNQYTYLHATIVLGHPERAAHFSSLQIAQTSSSSADTSTISTSSSRHPELMIRGTQYTEHPLGALLSPDGSNNNTDHTTEKPSLLAALASLSSHINPHKPVIGASSSHLLDKVSATPMPHIALHAQIGPITLLVGPSHISQLLSIGEIVSHALDVSLSLTSSLAVSSSSSSSSSQSLPPSRASLSQSPPPLSLTVIHTSAWLLQCNTVYQEYIEEYVRSNPHLLQEAQQAQSGQYESVHDYLQYAYTALGPSLGSRQTLSSPFLSESNYHMLLSLPSDLRHLMPDIDKDMTSSSHRSSYHASTLDQLSLASAASLPPSYIYVSSAEPQKSTSGDSSSSSSSSVKSSSSNMYRVLLSLRDVATFTVNITSFDAVIMLSDPEPIHNMPHCARRSTHGIQSHQSNMYTLNKPTVVHLGRGPGGGTAQHTSSFVHHNNNSSSNNSNDTTQNHCDCIDCLITRTTRTILRQQLQKRLKALSSSSASLSGSSSSNHNHISSSLSSSSSSLDESSSMMDIETIFPSADDLSNDPNLHINYAMIYQITRRKMQQYTASCQKMTAQVSVLDASHHHSATTTSQSIPSSSDTANTNGDHIHNKNIPASISYLPMISQHELSDPNNQCDCLYCLSTQRRGMLYPNSYDWWNYSIYPYDMISSSSSSSTDNNQASQSYTSQSSPLYGQSKVFGIHNTSILPHKHEYIIKSIIPCDHLIIHATNIISTISTNTHGTMVSLSIDNLNLLQGLKKHFVPVSPLQGNMTNQTTHGFTSLARQVKSELKKESNMFKKRHNRQHDDEKRQEEEEEEEEEGVNDTPTAATTATTRSDITSSQIPPTLFTGTFFSYTPLVVFQRSSSSSATPPVLSSLSDHNGSHPPAIHIEVVTLNKNYYHNHYSLPIIARDNATINPSLPLPPPSMVNVLYAQYKEILTPSSILRQAEVCDIFTHLSQSQQAQRDAITSQLGIGDNDINGYSLTGMTSTILKNSSSSQTIPEILSLLQSSIPLSSSRLNSIVSSLLCHADIRKQLVLPSTASTLHHHNSVHTQTLKRQDGIYFPLPSLPTLLYNIMPFDSSLSSHSDLFVGKHALKSGTPGTLSILDPADGTRKTTLANIDTSYPYLLFHPFSRVPVGILPLPLPGDTIYTPPSQQSGPERLMPLSSRVVVSLGHMHCSFDLLLPTRLEPLIMAIDEHQICTRLVISKHIIRNTHALTAKQNQYVGTAASHPMPLTRTTLLKQSVSSLPSTSSIPLARSNTRGHSSLLGRSLAHTASSHSTPHPPRYSVDSLHPLPIPTTVRDLLAQQLLVLQALLPHAVKITEGHIKRVSHQDFGANATKLSQSLSSSSSDDEGTLSSSVSPIIGPQTVPHLSWSQNGAPDFRSLAQIILNQSSYISQPPLQHDMSPVPPKTPSHSSSQVPPQDASEMVSEILSSSSQSIESAPSTDTDIQTMIVSPSPPARSQDITSQIVFLVPLITCTISAPLMNDSSIQLAPQTVGDTTTRSADSSTPIDHVAPHLDTHLFQSTSTIQPYIFLQSEGLSAEHLARLAADEAEIQKQEAKDRVLYYQQANIQTSRLADSNNNNNITNMGAGSSTYDLSHITPLDHQLIDPYRRQSQCMSQQQHNNNSMFNSPCNGTSRSPTPFDVYALVDARGTSQHSNITLTLYNLNVSIQHSSYQASTSPLASTSDPLANNATAKMVSCDTQTPDALLLSVPYEHQDIYSHVLYKAMSSVSSSSTAVASSVMAKTPLRQLQRGALISCPTVFFRSKLYQNILNTIKDISSFTLSSTQHDSNKDKTIQSTTHSTQFTKMDQDNLLKLSAIVFPQGVFSLHNSLALLYHISQFASTSLEMRKNFKNTSTSSSFALPSMNILKDILVDDSFFSGRSSTTQHPSSSRTRPSHKTQSQQQPHLPSTSSSTFLKQYQLRYDPIQTGTFFNTETRQTEPVHRPRYVSRLLPLRPTTTSKLFSHLTSLGISTNDLSQPAEMASVSTTSININVSLVEAWYTYPAALSPVIQQRKSSSSSSVGRPTPPIDLIKKCVLSVVCMPAALEPILDSLQLKSLRSYRYALYNPEHIDSSLSHIDTKYVPTILPDYLYGSSLASSSYAARQLLAQGLVRPESYALSLRAIGQDTSCCFPSVSVVITSRNIPLHLKQQQTQLHLALECERRYTKHDPKYQNKYDTMYATMSHDVPLVVIPSIKSSLTPDNNNNPQQSMSVPPTTLPLSSSLSSPEMPHHPYMIPQLSTTSNGTYISPLAILLQSTLKVNMAQQIHMSKANYLGANQFNVYRHTPIDLGPSALDYVTRYKATEVSPAPITTTQQTATQKQTSASTSQQATSSVPSSSASPSQTHLHAVSTTPLSPLYEQIARVGSKINISIDLCTVCLDIGAHEISSLLLFVDSISTVAGYSQTLSQTALDTQLPNFMPPKRIAGSTLVSYTQQRAHQDALSCQYRTGIDYSWIYQGFPTLGWAGNMQQYSMAQRAIASHMDILSRKEVDSTFTQECQSDIALVTGMIPQTARSLHMLYSSLRRSTPHPSTAVKATVDSQDSSQNDTDNATARQPATPLSSQQHLDLPQTPINAANSNLYQTGPTGALTKHKMSDSITPSLLSTTSLSSSPLIQAPPLSPDHQNALETRWFLLAMAKKIDTVFATAQDIDFMVPLSYLDAIMGYTGAITTTNNNNNNNNNNTTIQSSDWILPTFLFYYTLSCTNILAPHNIQFLSFFQRYLSLGLKQITASQTSINNTITAAPYHLTIWQDVLATFEDHVIIPQPQNIPQSLQNQTLYHILDKNSTIYDNITHSIQLYNPMAWSQIICYILNIKLVTITTRRAVGYLPNITPTSTIDPKQFEFSEQTLGFLSHAFTSLLPSIPEIDSPFLSHTVVSFPVYKDPAMSYRIILLLTQYMYLYSQDKLPISSSEHQSEIDRLVKDMLHQHDKTSIRRLLLQAKPPLPSDIDTTTTTTTTTTAAPTDNHESSLHHLFDIYTNDDDNSDDSTDDDDDDDDNRSRSNTETLSRTNTDSDLHLPFTSSYSLLPTVLVHDTLFYGLPICLLPLSDDYISWSQQQDNLDTSITIENSSNSDHDSHTDLLYTAIGGDGGGDSDGINEHPRAQPLPRLDTSSSSESAYSTVSIDDEFYDPELLPETPSASDIDQLEYLDGRLSSSSHIITDYSSFTPNFSLLTSLLVAFQSIDVLWRLNHHECVNYACIDPTLSDPGHNCNNNNSNTDENTDNDKQISCSTCVSISHNHGIFADIHDTIQFCHPSTSGLLKQSVPINYASSITQASLHSPPLFTQLPPFDYPHDDIIFDDDYDNFPDEVSSDHSRRLESLSSPSAARHITPTSALSPQTSLASLVEEIAEYSNNHDDTTTTTSTSTMRTSPTNATSLLSSSQAPVFLDFTAPGEDSESAVSSPRLPQTSSSCGPDEVISSSIVTDYTLPCPNSLQQSSLGSPADSSTHSTSSRPTLGPRSYHHRTAMHSSDSHSLSLFSSPYLNIFPPSPFLYQTYLPVPAHPLQILVSLSSLLPTTSTLDGSESLNDSISDKIQHTTGRSSSVVSAPFDHPSSPSSPFDTTSSSDVTNTNSSSLDSVGITISTSLLSPHRPILDKHHAPELKALNNLIEQHNKSHTAVVEKFVPRGASTVDFAMTLSAHSLMVVLHPTASVYKDPTLPIVNTPDIANNHGYTHDSKPNIPPPPAKTDSSTSSSSSSSIRASLESSSSFLHKYNKKRSNSPERSSQPSEKQNVSKSKRQDKRYDGIGHSSSDDDSHHTLGDDDDDDDDAIPIILIDHPVESSTHDKNKHNDDDRNQDSNIDDDSIQDETSLSNDSESIHDNTDSMATTKTSIDAGLSSFITDTPHFSIKTAPHQSTSQHNKGNNKRTQRPFPIYASPDHPLGLNSCDPSAKTVVFDIKCIRLAVLSKISLPHNDILDYIQHNPLLFSTSLEDCLQILTQSKNRTSESLQQHREQHEKQQQQQHKKSSSSSDHTSNNTNKSDPISAMTSLHRQAISTSRILALAVSHWLTVTSNNNLRISLSCSDIILRQYADNLYNTSYDQYVDRFLQYSRPSDYDDDENDDQDNDDEYDLLDSDYNNTATTSTDHDITTISPAEYSIGMSLVENTTTTILPNTLPPYRSTLHSISVPITDYTVLILCPSMPFAYKTLKTPPSAQPNHKFDYTNLTIDDAISSCRYDSSAGYDTQSTLHNPPSNIAGLAPSDKSHILCSQLHFSEHSLWTELLHTTALLCYPRRTWGTDHIIDLTAIIYDKYSPVVIDSNANLNHSNNSTGRQQQQHQYVYNQYDHNNNPTHNNIQTTSSSSSSSSPLATYHPYVIKNKITELSLALSNLCLGLDPASLWLIPLIGIFSDIGDNQNVSFASYLYPKHMVEPGIILNEAWNQSLLHSVSSWSLQRYISKAKSTLSNIYGETSSSSFGLDRTHTNSSISSSAATFSQRTLSGLPGPTISLNTSSSSSSSLSSSSAQPIAANDLTSFKLNDSASNNNNSDTSNQLDISALFSSSIGGSYSHNYDKSSTSSASPNLASQLAKTPFFRPSAAPPLPQERPLVPSSSIPRPSSFRSHVVHPSQSSVLGPMDFASPMLTPSRAYPAYSSPSPFDSISHSSHDGLDSHIMFSPSNVQEELEIIHSETHIDDSDEYTEIHPLAHLPSWFVSPSTIYVSVKAHNCIVDYNPHPYDVTFKNLTRQQIASQIYSGNTTTMTNTTDILTDPVQSLSIPHSYVRSNARALIAIPSLYVSVVTASFMPLTVNLYVKEASLLLLDKSLKPSYMPSLVIHKIPLTPEQYAHYSASTGIATSAIQSSHDTTQSSHKSARKKHSQARQALPDLDALTDTTILYGYVWGPPDYTDMYDNQTAYYPITSTHLVYDPYQPQQQKQSTVCINRTRKRRQNTTTSHNKYSRLSIIQPNSLYWTALYHKYKVRLDHNLIPAAQQGPLGQLFHSTSGLNASDMPTLRDFDHRFLLYRQLWDGTISNDTASQHSLSIVGHAYKHLPSALFVSALSSPFISNIPSNYDIIKHRTITNVTTLHNIPQQNRGSPTRLGLSPSVAQFLLDRGFCPVMTISSASLVVEKDLSPSFIHHNTLYNQSMSNMIPREDHKTKQSFLGQLTTIALQQLRLSYGLTPNPPVAPATTWLRPVPSQPPSVTMGNMTPTSTLSSLAPPPPITTILPSNNNPNNTAPIITNIRSLYHDISPYNDVMVLLPNPKAAIHPTSLPQSVQTTITRELLLSQLFIESAQRHGTTHHSTPEQISITSTSDGMWSTAEDIDIVSSRYNMFSFKPYLWLPAMAQNEHQQPDSDTSTSHDHRPSSSIVGITNTFPWLNTSKISSTISHETIYTVLCPSDSQPPQSMFLEPSQDMHLLLAMATNGDAPRHNGTQHHISQAPVLPPSWSQTLTRLIYCPHPHPYTLPPRYVSIIMTSSTVPPHALHQSSPIIPSPGHRETSQLSSVSQIGIEIGQINAGACGDSLSVLMSLVKILSEVLVDEPVEAEAVSVPTIEESTAPTIDTSIPLNPSNSPHSITALSGCHDPDAVPLSLGSASPILEGHSMGPYGNIISHTHTHTGSPLMGSLTSSLPTRYSQHVAKKTSPQLSAADSPLDMSLPPLTGMRVMSMSPHTPNSSSIPTTKPSPILATANGGGVNPALPTLLPIGATPDYKPSSRRSSIQWASPITRPPGSTTTPSPPAQSHTSHFQPVPLDIRVGRASHTSDVFLSPLGLPDRIGQTVSPTHSYPALRQEKPQQTQPPPQPQPLGTFIIDEDYLSEKPSSQHTTHNVVFNDPSWNDIQRMVSVTDNTSNATDLRHQHNISKINKHLHHRHHNSNDDDDDDDDVQVSTNVEYYYNQRKKHNQLLKEKQQQQSDTNKDGSSSSKQQSQQYVRTNNNNDILTSLYTQSGQPLTSDIIEKHDQAYYSQQLNISNITATGLNQQQHVNNNNNDNYSETTTSSYNRPDFVTIESFYPEADTIMSSLTSYFELHPIIALYPSSLPRQQQQRQSQSSSNGPYTSHHPASTTGGSTSIHRESTIPSFASQFASKSILHLFIHDASLSLYNGTDFMLVSSSTSSTSVPNALVPHYGSVLHTKQDSKLIDWVSILALPSFDAPLRSHIIDNNFNHYYTRNGYSPDMQLAFSRLVSPQSSRQARILELSMTSLALHQNSFGLQSHVNSCYGDPSDEFLSSCLSVTVGSLSIIDHVKLSPFQHILLPIEASHLTDIGISSLQQRKEAEQSRSRPPPHLSSFTAPLTAPSTTLVDLVNNDSLSHSESDDDYLHHDSTTDDESGIITSSYADRHRHIPVPSTSPGTPRGGGHSTYKSYPSTPSSFTEASAAQQRPSSFSSSLPLSQQQNQQQPGSTPTSHTLYDSINNDDGDDVDDDSNPFDRHGSNALIMPISSSRSLLMINMATVVTPYESHVNNNNTNSQHHTTATDTSTTASTGGQSIETNNSEVHFYCALSSPLKINLHQSTEHDIVSFISNMMQYSDLVPSILSVYSTQNSTLHDINPYDIVNNNNNNNNSDDDNNNNNDNHVVVVSDVYISSFYLSNILLCVDYVPIGANLSDLTKGQYSELLHLLTLDNLILNLPQIKLHPSEHFKVARGWSSLLPYITQHYLNSDVIKQQAMAVALSSSPLTAVTNVVDGMYDIICMPITGTAQAKRGAAKVLKGGLTAVRQLLTLTSNLMDVTGDIVGHDNTSQRMIQRHIDHNGGHGIKNSTVNSSSRATNVQQQHLENEYKTLSRKYDIHPLDNNIQHDGALSKRTLQPMDNNKMKHRRHRRRRYRSSASNNNDDNDDNDDDYDFGDDSYSTMYTSDDEDYDDDDDDYDNNGNDDDDDDNNQHNTHNNNDDLSALSNLSYNGKAIDDDIINAVLSNNTNKTSLIVMTASGQRQIITIQPPSQQSSFNTMANTTNNNNNTMSSSSSSPYIVHGTSSSEQAPPQTITDGFTQSWNILSSSFERAVHNIVTIPAQDYREHGGLSALNSALKGVPSLVLQPATGTVKAAAHIVSGFVSSLNNNKLQPTYKPGYKK